MPKAACRGGLRVQLWLGPWQERGRGPDGKGLWRCRAKQSGQRKDPRLRKPVGPTAGHTAARWQHPGALTSSPTIHGSLGPWLPWGILPSELALRVHCDPVPAALWGVPLAPALLAPRKGLAAGSVHPSGQPPTETVFPRPEGLRDLARVPGQGPRV